MSARVAFVQRVCADYRLPFFDSLSEWFDLDVYYGSPVGNDDIRELSQSRPYLKNLSARYFLNENVWWLRSTLSKIKQQPPDIVFVSPTPRCLIFLPLLLFCRRHSIPVYGWGMGEMPGRSRLSRYLHRNLQRIVVKRLNGIVCYSRRAKQYYKSLGFGGCLSVAPNAVNLDFVKRIEYGWGRKNEVAFNGRRSGSVRSDMLNLIFIGRINSRKNLESLLSIVEKNEILQISVVGDGNISYVEALKSITEPFSERVVFHGHLDPGDLFQLCRQHDLFVLPGRGGLAINHAMACGLPVVCSDGDGTEQDLVIDGETGYRFPDRQWPRLEELLVKCAAEKDHLRVMGDNANRLLFENFSLDAMSLAFRNAIWEALQ